MPSTLRILVFLLLILPTAARGGDTATSPTTRTLNQSEIKTFIREGIEKTKDIDVVWSRFRQQRHLAVFDEVLEARGQLAFSRDGSMRWEIKAPFHSVLVRNKNAIAKWEWKDEQWRKMQLGAEKALSEMLQRIGNWMQGDLESVEKQGFNLRVSRHIHQPCWQVIMEPKSEKQKEYIEKIVLQLEGDPPEIKKVVLSEPGANKTIITFHDRILNPELPKGFFDPENKPVILDAAPEGQKALPAEKAENQKK